MIEQVIEPVADLVNQTKDKLTSSPETPSSPPLDAASASDRHEASDQGPADKDSSEHTTTTGTSDSAPSHHSTTTTTTTSASNTNMANDQDDDVQQGSIFSVSGPVIVAENMIGCAMYELCKVGHDQLVGEVVICADVLCTFVSAGSGGMNEDASGDTCI